ncbi:MAG TPA: DUF1592 domain-containing protein [Oligoflexus sp.]|uniref:DUF1592 domain-containing protein n=1 Tax=Oligoflexus sp. TaxID=1971216 RepID=UPI002D7FB610|nr:DUF1592 domain-containing protein [Oligoflexus sp.]HET9237197.1 DUF1592 domain-containing protein [Oligoflexus sp.]
MRLAPTLGLLVFELSLTACGGRKSSGPQSDARPNSMDFSQVTSPAMATLDLGQQNLVFRKIMEAAQQPSCTEPSQEKQQARLLTNDEYMQSLADVFGLNPDDKTIRDQLLVESRSLGFRNLQGFGLVSPDRLKGLFAATEIAIPKIIETRRDLLQCGQGQGSPCVRSFLETALPRLWKKSVSRAELDDLIRFFEDSGADNGALQILLQRLLISPYLIFRTELGSEGHLSSMEMTSILASTLWASVPDQALMDKAKGDALATPEAIAQEADRMIKDPRAWRGLHQFVIAWLETDRLNSASKMSMDAANMSPELKQALTLQTSDFLFYLVQNKQDSFQNILTAPFTVGTDGMAQYYSLNAGTAESIRIGNRTLKKFAVDPSQKGLFAQGGFVSSLSPDNKTHIASRGSFVLSKLLCHYLEVPPNLSSSASMAMTDPNLSARDNLTKLTEAPSCAGCHSFINGVGFALEGLNAFGQIRTQDDTFKPLLLDASFNTMGGTAVQVKGASGLSEALAQSEQAQLCLVTNVFRHTHGRLETTEDACTIASAYKKAKAAGLSYQDLVIQFLTSSRFLKR